MPNLATHVLDGYILLSAPSSNVGFIILADFHRPDGRENGSADRLRWFRRLLAGYGRGFNKRPWEPVGRGRHRCAYSLHRSGRRSPRRLSTFSVSCALKDAGADFKRLGHPGEILKPALRERRPA